jgi:antitoxin FitA
MEEEAREILRSALRAPSKNEEENLADAIRRRFDPFGGVELELPVRDAPRIPPDFSE